MTAGAPAEVGGIEPDGAGTEAAPRAAVGGAPRLTVIRDDGERVEPPVRAERALRAGEAIFVRLERALERVLGAELDPLAQTGAIANTSLIIAIVSGIVLLIWYSTSVHHAHASVAAMGQARFGAGLVRSVHRVSSDAAMLFVLLHATKLFFARRFGGARWLAWVTGMALLGLLWLVGWLGYWLVWDERGQLVALGTARLLDALPLFADPLSRSFLADDRLNSLLFFVIFFLHMLLPLVMGIALWLHITRLSRPWFLTRRPMTVWVVLTTLIVAVASPADLAGAARMSEIPRGFGAIDAWYLAPLALTDRLGAGALWAVVLGVGVLSFSVPWLFARGRARVARVEPALCNACEKCYHDCPYDAIQMVPRPAGGKPIATMALVDPAKCLGCGICAGSCDSAGVGLDWFSVVDQRKRIDRLIERALERNERPLLALVCNESAGNGLVIDEATGVSPELPGYVVVRVPCAGWVHPLTVERALRRNAEGVLIVASGPSACMYREGSQWTVQRMTGQRAPALNTNKVDPDRVRVLELFRTEKRRLVLEAAAFRERAAPRQARRSRTTRLVSGLGVAALVGLVTWGGTRVGWASQADPSPKLVVSFKHPGVAAENCREPSPEELAKFPKHMQAKKICERRRANVRLRVHIDGREVVARAYEPRGIWHDGNSIGIERIPTKPGPHEVRVELGDSADAAAYDFSATRTVTMRERHNTVVLFDKMSGFTWYE